MKRWLIRGALGLFLALPAAAMAADKESTQSSAEAPEEKWWDPYEEMELMNERLDRLFGMRTGPAFRIFHSSQDIYSPDVDLEETAEAFIIKASVPGFEKNQISVEVRGNAVLISGRRDAEEKTEKQTQEGRKFFMRESRSGSFTRLLQIPGKFNERTVSAECKNGVLTVTLPKLQKEEPVKSKKIKIL